MSVNEMIYKRKSVRSYLDTPVDENMMKQIEAFLKTIKPLYPDIKTEASIVSKDKIKSVLPLPWLPAQHIAVYSEDKPGAFENVGFMFQQADLYLQSLGIGTCWLGLGRMSDPKEADKGNMKFIIMIAFGQPKGDAQRTSSDEFKRRSLKEIADSIDERLEPARLAPSAVNSQPWYFVHEGDVIRAYCAHNKMLRDMNKIDMGICLAHMYVSNSDTFNFFKEENAPDIKGHDYIGSFTI